ncbi:3,4-dihydroxy-2-butanone-4-phosphate synthase [Microvirga massiliensis]|uniref:3,4-dihydroxy-2-butanone-4-phosphate synthase n=1 Tax=Microvirga massiliensis TaxID=1033741 RepID=UPI00062B9610|nr:3,4-dihydroxy-2-butanone-4-phosphate synthase [Microvirga massiliensis]
MNFMAMPRVGQELSDTSEIIWEAQAGRPFILIDDEDRENEGDIVVPAQFASAEIINFMARYGRGLICLAITQERASKLRLSLMARSGEARHQTAFTHSIEARHGVTTGISAADRAHTIAVAIDPEATAEDIVTPGHVFPLITKEGGTFARAGHTEAAVDVARLAGLNPSGVICEVMNDDGTMARLPDLLRLAHLHRLKVGTIADLVAYRLRAERLVDRILTSTFDFPTFGEWELLIYRDKIEGGEHIVLTRGNLEAAASVPVYMHVADAFSNMLLACEGGSLHDAMRRIAIEGCGAVMFVAGDKIGVSERISDTNAPSMSNTLQRSHVAAQILVDLGVRGVTLLSKTIAESGDFAEYGLRITDVR